MYARDRFPDTKKRFFSPGQCQGVIATERRRNRRIGALEFGAENSAAAFRVTIEFKS